jgi:hypothetical protein
MWYRGSVVAAIAIVALASRLWLSATAAHAAGAGKADIVRPGEEPDDGIQGLYVGTFTAAGESTARPTEARVLGEGGGNFRALLTAGEGDKTVPFELSGKLDGGKVALTGKVGTYDVTGKIADRKLTAEAKGGGKYVLTYTVSKSPTEGQKSPAGAIILLAYSPHKAPSLAEWANNSWEALADGSMVKGGGDIRTKRGLGDMQLHLEFRCPYLPTKHGQERGNSGVYLMDRYEVQVLDSFGLVPQDNECGGIYKVATPKVNASYPPDVWQTYDITFRAPRFDAQGKKVKNAAVTVVQNGLTIHENVEIPGPTGGAVGGPEAKEAPLRLQDHGNPVRFRNIWALPLKEGQAPPALKVPAASK